MKKLFFVAVAILGLVNLNAQEKTTKTQFGVKTSLNASTIVHSGFKELKLSGTDYRFGYGAGVYAHIPFSKSFALQPEVNIARLGSKNVPTYEGVNKSSGRFTTDYITVPVLLQYSPGGGRFNIEAGPQVGYNIYASSESKTSSNASGVYSLVASSKENVRKNVTKFDYGVTFGLGYNVTDNINLALRYYIGLQSVDKSKKVDTEDISGAGAKVDRVWNSFTDKTPKNNSFSFSVGYSF